MKKLVLLFMLFALIVPAITAQDGFSVNGSPTSVPFTDKKIRPKDMTGSNQQVIGYYADGVLTISFEEPEGRTTLKVTRMDDGAMQTTSFYTISTFTYTMGTTPGTYVLNLKTSQCEYEGYLTIE